MPMRKLLGFLAILVNLGLSVFCAAVAGLAWIDGGEFSVPLLPVAPENAAASLMAAGVIGIASSVLAMLPRRLAGLPMLVWSVGLLFVLTAAVFRGSYRFDGVEGLIEHAFLVAGALVLVFLSSVRVRRASRTNPLPHIARPRQSHSP